MQQSNLFRAGLTALAALLLCVGFLTSAGQVHADNPPNHGGRFQPNASCYGTSCNGQDPYYSGCVNSATTENSITVTGNEVLRMMFSSACNAVYAQVELPGTTVDIDADIASGSVLYHSGGSTFSPMRSPMIAMGNAGVYTYTATGCYGAFNCQSFGYAFPDLSTSPTSDQSAQIRSRLDHFATLVSEDQLGQAITAIGNASDTLGCANTINEAQPEYVNGIYSLIFLADIASSCSKVVLEQISQDIDSWNMKGYINVNSALESIDECLNSGACDSL
jgi:Protein of unknown function (DUF2690)